MYILNKLKNNVIFGLNHVESAFYRTKIFMYYMAHKLTQVFCLKTKKKFNCINKNKKAFMLSEVICLVNLFFKWRLNFKNNLTLTTIN